MKIQFVKIGSLNFPCNCLHSRSRIVTDCNGVARRIYYPCGKCYRCRKRLASQWAFRCETESEDRFVYNMKFTYSDDKLPFYKGKPSLNRQQLQDAFKRLRYYLDKHHKFKIRFFANGEYSPESERPHYHAILFSPVELENFSDKGKTLEWLNGKFEKGQRITDGYLAKVWPYGIASINKYDSSRGGVGPMVGYMVNYMFTVKPSSSYDQFNKPFRMMSRGIGDRLENVYPKVLPNCRKRGQYTFSVPHPKLDINVAYPRYYRNKWMSETEKQQAANDFYVICQQFFNYINFLTNEEKQKRALEVRFRAAEERREELFNFRKRKVHKRN